MNRYVALLRGINVGGHAVIKMADVRKLCESLGLADVTTYIQSGNVIFAARDTNTHRLARQIEEPLAGFMGRPVTVFVLSQAELKEAAAHNPFEPERRQELQRCHLMFLTAAPDAEHSAALMARQGEEYQFHLHDRVLYYAYSREWDGRRRAIDFERVLGVAGTTRNWMVVNKLIELADPV